MQSISRRLASISLVLLIAAGKALAGGGYVQTNLVSDIPGMAALTDSNLQDPWGIALSTKSPFWVSDQATSVATLYSVNSTTGVPSIVPLVAALPNQGGAPASPPPVENDGPTGQVSTTAPGITTATTDFNFTSGGVASRAAFIFANLDGSISAWKSPSTPAAIVAMVPGASFTGLAIGNSSTGPEIYAADQNSGKIYVFNNQFHEVGSFSDPNYANLQTMGYKAFNVQNLSVNGVQTLFVTYANQATSGGVVDEFTTNGTFLKTLISDTGTNPTLAAPWGLALAPANWGQFGGDLLVANNNGPGTINAYDVASGVLKGSLTINAGPASNSSPDLWGITFGNGGNGGSTDTLYFTAGLASNGDGLFGAISVPEPRSAILGLIAMAFVAAGWGWRNRRYLARA